MHPRIRQAWLASDRPVCGRGVSAAAVVIPLLYETNAAAAFDFVLCTACSLPSQRPRLLARGWSENELNQRISAQFPIEKKMQLSDFVIWTEGSVELHAAQLDRVLQRIG